MSSKYPIKHLPASTVFTLAERCGPCGGMMSFRDRDSARRARKTTPTHGRLSVYVCPVNPDAFHLGHLPKSVLSGERDRADLVASWRPR